MRAAFTLLCWEGAFAMVYETWVGPTYLSGLAGELGVQVWMVTLLSSAAWVGSTGQLFGVWAFERVPSVRRYTLAIAMTARALWVFPLGFALYWHHQPPPGGFPTQRWFGLTAAVACVSALFGSASAVAWMSWTKGLISDRFRARFFAVRHRGIMVALILANLLGALWVGWRPGGLYAGYAALGALALVVALVSTVLLARVPDIKSVAHPKPRSLREIFAGPLRDREFRKVLYFGAAFNGAIQLAGGYFPYFFTHDLGIPMRSVALWFMLNNLGCLVAIAYWGRRVDRMGDPRRMLWWIAHALALSPLPYLLPGHIIAWLGPIEYFFNGTIWAAYFVCSTTLLFRVIPAQRNAAWFSLYAACSGLAGAVCTALGGQLALWLAPYGGFRALWVIAAAARLAVIWIFLRALLYSAKADVKTRSITGRAHRQS